jgi:hypothetical protein
MTMGAVKIDRRKRHADNPSVPINAGLPRRLLQRLDDEVVRRRATRNGVIAQALTAYLNACDFERSLAEGGADERER